MADLAFFLQIGEVLQRVEITPVTVIPPMELQQVEGIDPHPLQRHANCVLNDRAGHRSGIRHPFGESLDFMEPVGAVPLGKAAAEFADQILGRAVMVGEVPGHEAGIVIGEHRLDSPRRIDPAMRARHLPHPIQGTADIEIGRQGRTARCRRRHGRSSG
jgi:hypothetical protein